MKIWNNKPMAAAVFAALAWANTAVAAEDFQVRYNLAGSLGGEMFAPPNQVGWAGALAVTYMDITKVTGNGGKELTRLVPGGTVAVPNAPPALHPSYGTSVARIDAAGTMTQSNLALAYATTDDYAGGRLVFLLNVPFAKKSQTFNVAGTPPELNWNPAVPAPVRTAVSAGFNSQYQAGLNKQASDATGKVEGIGDAELQAGWLYVGDKLRVLAGASVVLPTGKYNAASAPDIGFGNYYTFRPAVQAAYLPTPEIAFSTKLTWAVNTRNRDNDLRSGNWAALELAAGYKTPIGVVGVHGIHVQQYQDDSNNPWGASRFRSTNAGVFFTTKIAPINAAITLQYMASTDSRNAKHGSFSQIRIIKLF